MSFTQENTDYTTEFDGKVWYYHLWKSDETCGDSYLMREAASPFVLAMRYRDSPTSYVYSSFSSEEEKVNHVQQYDAAEEDHYYDVVSHVPLNKIHFSFITSNSGTAAGVVHKILDTLYSFYTEGGMTFGEKDVRIYTIPSKNLYCVTDITHYFASDHVRHVASLVVNKILSTLPTGSVEFGDEYEAGSHVPIYTTSHLFRYNCGGEEYSVITTNGTKSCPLPRRMVPQERMEEEMERSIIRETLITSRDSFSQEHNIVKRTYCPVPESVTSSEETYAAAERHLYSAHPSLINRFQRSGNVLIATDLFFCDACGGNHPEGWHVEMRYAASLGGFCYWCVEEHAGSRYFETGRPWPQELAYVVNSQGLARPDFPGGPGTGYRVEPAYPAYPAGYENAGRINSEENRLDRYYVPYSDCPKHTLYIAYRTAHTAPLDSYACSLKTVEARNARKGREPTDESTLYYLMGKLYDLGTKMSEDYKVRGGEVIDFKTGKAVRDVSVRVKVALPSLQTGKGATKYLSLSFTCAQILSGTFRWDQALRMKDVTEDTAELKRNLEDRIHFWRMSGPIYPDTPCNIPFFRGEPVPLFTETDINVSCGFPCDPTRAVSRDYATLKGHFPRIRALVKHGYCAGDAGKKKAFMSWNAYILTHLNDPQTLKAFLLGGPQGCGKSIWIALLNAIYGGLCAPATMKGLCGEFNATINGRLILTLDEPVTSSTRNAHDNADEIKNRMKELIAGSGYIPTTRKCKDTVTMKNLANVFITTNNFNVAGIDSDDKRRYIIFRTRSIGETSAKVIVTSADRTFIDPIDTKGNPVVLAPEDTPEAMITRFFAPIVAMLKHQAFADNFAAYLLAYGKKHDTSFIRTYEQDFHCEDREEMLRTSACTTEEFLSKFISDEYSTLTPLPLMQPKAFPSKETNPEGIHSYYVPLASLYAEYRAWYSKAYAAGSPVAERKFGAAVTEFSKAYPAAVFMATDTKAGGDKRVQEAITKPDGKPGTKKWPAGILFRTGVCLMPEHTPVSLFVKPAGTPSLPA